MKQHGWPRFNDKLWQRNYYEHIVSDDNELNRIRQYIADNPPGWEMDRENPNATTSAEARRAVPAESAPANRHREDRS